MQGAKENAFQILEETLYIKELFEVLQVAKVQEASAAEQLLLPSLCNAWVQIRPSSLPLLNFSMCGKAFPSLLLSCF